MAQSKTWVVTTSGDRPLNEVKSRLTKAGFSVDQVLDEIGSITGTVNDEDIEKLRSIPGVADVSPNQPVDIGPPDAPVTW